jgi:DNA glycosylase AlkZ-like
MPERVLTQRELNRTLLARQLLLERKKLAPVALIERLVGMQAQWPPAPYVGIWSRATTFRRATLERSLLATDVVKASLMRNTLHLVTRRDYPVFWTALHDIPSWPDAAAIADGVRVAPLIRELALAGPLRAQDGLAYLEREHGFVDAHRTRVWHVARTRSHVTHAPQTALWSSRPQALFAPVDEPEPVEKLAAISEIIRRYLGAFGPASRADIATWSGMRIADFSAALETLEPLRRFHDERGRELLDLPRAPLPAADVPAPVRLLPKWDNLLLSHDDRTRVLPEEYRKRVIAKNGDVGQTFLVDGVVAGEWTADAKGKIALTLYAPLPRVARRELEDEAARLEAWLR